MCDCRPVVYMLQHIRLNEEVMDMPAEAPMVALLRSCSIGRLQILGLTKGASKPREGNSGNSSNATTVTVISSVFESESDCCSVDEGKQGSI